MYHRLKVKENLRAFLKTIPLKSQGRGLQLLIFIVFFCLLIFTRVYNLDHTSRFTQDESLNLVRMHEYFVDRKVTLVGTISNNGVRVFGSLTYYMLMPFTIIGHFDPISEVYGTAFYGILTVLMLLVVVKRINKKLLFFALALLLVWFPLVQSSRWAWQPYLVPFWMALGVLFLLFDTPLLLFLSGLSFGLSVHIHFIALLAAGAFMAIYFVRLLLQRRLKDGLLFGTGFVLALLPFAIFDLRHPPGFFFTHFFTVHAIPTQSHYTFLSLLGNLLNVTWATLMYFSQNAVLAVLLGVGIAVLIFLDIRDKNGGLMYGFSWIAQVVGGAFLDFQIHYLTPTFVFLIVWLFYPRKALPQNLSKGLMVILIIGGIISIVPQLTVTEVPPDIYSDRAVVKIIEQTTRDEHLKNINLAELQSPSTDVEGLALRDMLLIDNVPIRLPGDYDVSENQFVMSTSSEAALRRDKSAAMAYFGSGQLAQEWNIPNSPWKLYLFKPNPRNQ